MAGDARPAEAVDGQFQEPGDEQGEQVGAGKEEGAEEIASAVLAEIAYEKGKLADSRLLSC
jgi:hypothetical protein